MASHVRDWYIVKSIVSYETSLLRHPVAISILGYKVVLFSLPLREESNKSTEMANNYLYSMSCFGKFYSPQQIYEITCQYWALEDEFYYPMTSRDPYSDIIACAYGATGVDIQSKPS